MRIMNRGPRGTCAIDLLELFWGFIFRAEFELSVKGLFWMRSNILSFRHADRGTLGLNF